MMQVIRNAKLVNGRTQDIVIENGKIIDMTAKFKGHAKEIILPEDVYTSAGWIDLHTHSFSKYRPYGDFPDEIGYKTGVTTVVDAGSSGADDVDEFYQSAKASKTNVYAFLNISRIGLREIDELSNLDLVSIDLAEKILEKYPDFIVGFKARMSKSVVGENGIKPLQLATQFRDEFSRPLMVHIGSAPPHLDEVLEELASGDIVTHCFNEKENNHIFAQGDIPPESLKQAIKRGVKLDLGHGTESYSFDIARKAYKNNIHFDTISTDIYEGNREDGPVYNLATTMSKCMAQGYSLERVVDAVTIKPAQLIGKDHIGRLEKGVRADLTFFKLEDRKTRLTDSLGKTLEVDKQIKTIAVMKDGDYIELT